MTSPRLRALRFQAPRLIGVLGAATATLVWWLRPLLRSQDVGAIGPGAADIQRLTTIDMGLIVLTFLAVVALLVRAAADRLITHPPRTVWIPLALFFFASAMSALVSIHVFHSLHAFALLLQWVLLFLLAASLGRQSRWRRPTERGLFLIAFGIACLAVAQRWVVSSLEHEIAGDALLDRVFGTFASPGLYGGFLAILLPWQIGKADEHFTKSQEHGRGLIFALLAFSTLVALVLTRSRTAWIAAAIAMLLYLYITQRRKTLGIAIAACAAAVAALYVAAPQLFLLDTFVARLTYWQGTVGMIVRRPILGTGLGTWSDAYPTTMSSAGFPTVVAHNDWLQRFSETGIVGGLAFALFAFAVLRVGSRGWRRATDPSRRRMIAGLWCAVVALYIDACLDFPLHAPQLAPMAALVMGLLVAEGWGRGRPLPLADWGWVRTVAAFCLCMMFTGWMMRQAIGQAHLRMATLAAAHNDPVTFENECYRARSWLLLDPEPSSLLAAWRLRQGDRDGAPLSEYREAARLAEIAVLLAPWHPWYADRAGVAYWNLAEETGSDSHRQRAIVYFRASVEHFPAHPEFHERLADVLEWTGDRDAEAARAQAEIRRAEWRHDSAIAGPESLRLRLLTL